MVAECTPEDVVRIKKSYTGQALRAALNGHRAGKPA
jgi:excinuclease UvrABC ATPase subunit